MEKTLCHGNDTGADGSQLLEVHTDFMLRRDGEHQIISGVGEVVMKIRTGGKIRLSCSCSRLKHKGLFSAAGKSFKTRNA